MFILQHLDHVAIKVSNLARSVQWYCDILGMKHEFQGLWGGVPVMLSLGPTWLALFPAAADGATPPYRPFVSITLPCAPTGQTLKPPGGNCRPKASPLSFRIMRSATPSTFPTPTVIGWKLQPMISLNCRWRPCLGSEGSEQHDYWPL